MSFVAENDLERALMRATSDANARPEFYRQLLLSNLTVIGEVEGHAKGTGSLPGSGTLTSGQNVRLTQIQSGGRSGIPVFSSLTRLQTYARKEVPYLALNGRALFQMTKGALLVLNPGSQYGKELLPEEIANLIAPVPQQVTIDAPTDVLIGQPAVYPHALVDGLKSAFAARPDVLTAYLIQIAFPQAGHDPHPMIGIEHTGAWDDICKDVVRVATAAVPGMQVDLIPIDRAAPVTLTEALLKTQPFYQRPQ